MTLIRRPTFGGFFSFDAWDERSPELEAGRTAAEMAREVGVSTYTIYFWKAKYGGMEPSEAIKLWHLEDENSQAEEVGAEVCPDREMLEGAANKKRTELVDRRADAAFLMKEFAATQRRACELAHIARSTSRYQARLRRTTS